MKVILVGNTAWSMIKFRRALLMKLVSLEFDVYVLAPADSYQNEIKEIGCNFINISIDNKGASIYYDSNLFFQLKKLYKQISPNLIIHYTIKPNIYGTFAAKTLGIKSFAVVSGLGYVYIHKSIVTKIAISLYRCALKKTDVIIFINEDDRKDILNKRMMNTLNSFIFPSEGINVDFFKPREYNSSDTAFKFLLVSRLLWDKGIKEYVEAAMLIQEKYRNVEFMLLGFLDVENPTAIKKCYIDEWVSKKIINYLGSTDDIRDYVSNSDCIVLPSYREGKGMTLIEGASMEKPLIATNVVGCKDVVEDGSNGYLCEVQNADDLANKMEQMLNLSIDQRLKMGKNGRKKVLKEFDERIIISNYMKLINSVFIKKIIK